MPVPFTSKDRITYQINGKIKMSKERGNEHERLLSRYKIPSYLLHFKTYFLFSKTNKIQDHSPSMTLSMLHFKMILVPKEKC